MLEQEVRITPKGIEKALQEYTPEKAIAQYIWNGFDAKASLISVNVELNPIKFIESISVTDNGYGIPRDDLKAKFSPLFQSEKELIEKIKNTSATHGKTGVGRLTFFSFAKKAIWETIYKKGEKKFKYSIEINKGTLNSYIPTEEIETIEEPGTKVTFSGIFELRSIFIKDVLEPFIIRDFSWFLELNKENNFSLFLNGTNLDYSGLVGEKEIFTIEPDFDIKYVRWNDTLNGEYSKYYFIGSDKKEKRKFNTTLNNKGDHFYHSVYISSSFFNFFDSYDIKVVPQPVQPRLFEDEITKRLKSYVNLRNVLDKFLIEKRKPFLEQTKHIIIDELKQDGAFPKFTDNSWDQFRKKELEVVIGELYQFEPKIFNSLNVEQKKILTRLLNLVMDSNERDNLLKVVEGILSLDFQEKERFARILQLTTMSNVLATIKLIQDRFQALKDLEELVFNPNLKATELKQLQEIVENHYWLFGEQFHLVAAAERKFEEVLQRFKYYLTGNDSKRKLIILINLRKWIY